MKKIFLRADGGKSLGAGHAFRALALGQELAAKGFSVEAFSRSSDAEFFQKMKVLFSAAKIPLHPVTSETAFSVQLRNKPDLLVIDLPQRAEYAELLPFLKNIRILVFDDFYSNELKADLRVRPYFHKSQVTSPSLLAGPKYFVFRHDLVSAANPERERVPVKKVLITMGGSDPHKLTFPIAAALCSEHPDLQFTAVIGPAFPDSASIPSFPNLTLAQSPEHLGHLFAQADLAIIAGGLTKYETALFGLPSLIYAQTEEEERLGREFETLGTSRVLGAAKEFSAADLQNKFADLLQSPKELKALAQKGPEFIDTKGSERIIEKLQQKLS